MADKNTERPENVEPIHETETKKSDSAHWRELLQQQNSHNLQMTLKLKQLIVTRRKKIM